ncbi:hypothetical protein BCY91_04835 [Pelobium manganitolerans]|uniref:DUF2281 domain-containing protein n=1 Tax=Pelobium manganitolerans TaxID=1842495 RepID=A0A419S667_9SPHI|nr:DUF2281 domain-containing protein [Pelobium manganitolerans]RKD16206.1 hypothetical protein BCY91_04835 [Pelobium manganitolerans]
MTKQALIEKAVKVMQQLPDEKAVEVMDFAEFLFKQHEESQLRKDIHNMVSNGKTNAFLEEDEELYTLSDVKEPYNG